MVQSSRHFLRLVRARWNCFEMSVFPRTVALLIGAATHFLSRNLSEVQRSVTGQKGFVFFCLFLLGGTEREMSKNWGRSGVRQSSGNLFWKKTFALLTPACSRRDLFVFTKNNIQTNLGPILHRDSRSFHLSHQPPLSTFYVVNVSLFVTFTI